MPGQVGTSGTVNPVYVRLQGEEGHTREQLVSHGGVESNATLAATILDIDIGNVTAVSYRAAGPDNLFLEYINVVSQVPPVFGAAPRTPHPSFFCHSPCQRPPLSAPSLCPPPLLDAPHSDHRRLFRERPSSTRSTYCRSRSGTSRCRWRCRRALWRTSKSR